MELAIREAKARLSELITAVRNGERVIITKHGRPAAELVPCDRRGGIDFDKLEAARRRLGIEGDGERWPEEFDDPTFSRRVLGLDSERRVLASRHARFYVTAPVTPSGFEIVGGQH